MTEKRWFLGSSDTNDYLERYKDLIAKEINHYIFQTNWAGTELSTVAFQNRIYSQEAIEEEASIKMNKTFEFHTKWAYLKQLLD